MSAQGPKPVSGRVSVEARSHQDPDMLSLVESTKKPGVHYRWVRCRADEHARSVAKHRRKGYEPVKVDSGVRTHVEPDTRPDGVIAIGDMILMSCPEALFRQRTAERRSLTEARKASTTAVTKEMAREKGVRLIDDSDTDG